MRNLIGILFLTYISFFITSCCSKHDTIQGQWAGQIEIQGMKLNLVFDLSEKNDTLTGMFYSLNQTSKGIDVKDVEFKNSVLKVKIPSIGASYEGTLSDSIITGTFKQGFANLPLDLKRMKEGEFQLNNTVLSDAYESFDVKFVNEKDNVTLAGTITIPKQGKNFPAVVLVSGSGLQNRDSELMGHKPFERIADYLSSRGIAVLRYDDRGFGESNGDATTATTLNFMEDALAAVKFLKNYSERIDTDKIGIVGHSEGGAIAIMAAANDKGVNFIVSLAGPLMQGKDLLLLQADKILRANGQPDSVIQQNLLINSSVYTILEQEKDSTVIKQKIEKLISDSKLSDADKAKINLNDIYKQSLTPWVPYFIQLNTLDYINAVKCPALFMFAEKDLQVPAEENIASFNAAFKNSPDNIEFVAIKGLNHLFQKADKGTMDEYTNLNNPAMDDEVLNILFKYIESTIMK